MKSLLEYCSLDRCDAADTFGNKGLDVLMHVCKIIVVVCNCVLYGSNVYNIIALESKWKLIEVISVAAVEVVTEVVAIIRVILVQVAVVVEGIV